MQANLLRSPRLDGIDKEKFRAMLASDSFAILKSRIELQLQRSRDACFRGDEVRDVRRAQGAVHALETVLKLPDQILAEMSKTPGKE